MEFDLVIRNGTVIDGSGRPGGQADVGIDGARIAAVGKVDGRGAREIDAEGHVVTPGFVDGHTHMDAQVMWDPLGRNSCYHGVTTVIMGNCGFSLAPTDAARRHLVERNLERAEDISAEAMRAGIPDWEWATFSEYLQVLDRIPKGINYAANVGHSALRTWIMGERAFEQPASMDDLAAMGDELHEAMVAGAIGFTTSRNVNHETADDRPVASRIAVWEEVEYLVDRMSAAGGGVFQIANPDAVRSLDPAERRRSLRELLGLAQNPGVAVTFSIFGKRGEGPEIWQEHLAAIDDACAAGGRAFGMCSSRGITSLLSFETQMPFDSLPEWKPIRQLSLAEQAAALRDPVTRAQLVESANNGHYARAIGSEAKPPNYETLLILSGPYPPYRTVASVAGESGRDPVDVMIDTALDHDLRQFFIQPFSSSEPDVVVPIMKHPRAITTFSDSGAHVSQTMDSSIQTHLLGYWVREKQQFSLEEAVHMLSAMPAQAWSIPDRGLLREGMIADLNVFDPTTVGPMMPTVVDDLPAGAIRIDQRAVGFTATIVAGEVLLESGKPTGALPGVLVRRR